MASSVAATGVFCLLPLKETFERNLVLSSNTVYNDYDKQTGFNFKTCNLTSK